MRSDEVISTTDGTMLLLTANVPRHTLFHSDEQLQTTQQLYLNNYNIK